MRRELTASVRGHGCTREEKYLEMAGRICLSRTTWNAYGAVGTPDCRESVRSREDVASDDDSAGRPAPVPVPNGGAVVFVIAKQNLSPLVRESDVHLRGSGGGGLYGERTGRPWCQS